MSRSALARAPRGDELDVERAAAMLATFKDVDRVKDHRDKAVAIETWLRAQKASLSAQRDAAEIVVRSERRLGELLQLLPKATGSRAKPGGSKLSPPGIPTLAERGIEKRDASLWQRLASVPEAVFEQHVASIRERSEKITTRGTVAATSHVAGYDGDEAYTPPEYIEAAREVMGGIDLDPASCELAQRTVRATTYYTKRENGLVKPWKGRTWMNSPYSVELVGRFATRLMEHLNSGAVPQALALYNASTDTAWFHMLAAAAARTCFTVGRSSFIGPDGKPMKGNRVGQVFFYFGPNETAFQRLFREFGTVMRSCG